MMWFVGEHSVQGFGWLDVYLDGGRTFPHYRGSVAAVVNDGRSILILTSHSANACAWFINAMSSVYWNCFDVVSGISNMY
jgi:hypothetical protein